MKTTKRNIAAVLAAAAILALFGAAGCSQSSNPLLQGGGLTSSIAYLDVKITGQTPASTGDARPAFDAEVKIDFDVTAVNANGSKAASYSGVFEIKPTSGIIVAASPHFAVADDKSSARGTLAGGSLAGGSLTVKYGWGEVRLIAVEMVPDILDKFRYGPNGTVTGYVKGAAAGAAKPVYFARASIDTLNKIRVSATAAGFKSVIENKGVIIDYGAMVVTGATVDGFFVTDISVPGYKYASVYVYTMSAPTVDVGSVVKYLAGQYQNFYEFIEISGSAAYDEIGFDKTKVPLPIELTADSFADVYNKVAPYQSALVRLSNIYVQTMSASDEESYRKYGQWPAGFDKSSKTFYFFTTDTVPQFNPHDYAGTDKTFTITGNLRAHSATYIIQPRGAADIAGFVTK